MTYRTGKMIIGQLTKSENFKDWLVCSEAGFIPLVLDNPYLTN